MIEVSRVTTGHSVNGEARESSNEPAPTVQCIISTFFFYGTDCQTITEGHATNVFSAKRFPGRDVRRASAGGEGGGGGEHNFHVFAVARLVTWSLIDGTYHFEA